MLSIIPRILLYKMSYSLGFPRMMPMNYTVSLTYACNSRCMTCNIYEKKADNLRLEEYDKIFRKIGRSPYWVTLSGGEPFLRKDIVDICKLIYNRSRPAIINIPSNGILTEKIVNAVWDIAAYSRKSRIVINLSIDGIGEQHNRIRNVPDNYDKVMATYNALRELNLENLSIGIHTVISKFNVDSFASIANTLLELKPDSYITEIAEERVELDTVGQEITPNPLEYRSAIDFLIHRIKNRDFKGLSKITQAFRIEYYNLVKQILRDKTQVIPCYAGITSVQIAPDGDVWSCCIKAESMGNLRDFNYNFRRIWKSKEMDRERRSIKRKECYCPLANAAYTNMLMDIPTLMRVFYRSFIHWWN